VEGFGGVVLARSTRASDGMREMIVRANGELFSPHILMHDAAFDVIRVPAHVDAKTLETVPDRAFIGIEQVENEVTDFIRASLRDAPEDRRFCKFMSSHPRRACPRRDFDTYDEVHIPGSILRSVWMEGCVETMRVTLDGSVVMMRERLIDVEDAALTDTQVVQLENVLLRHIRRGIWA
jgi:hypothetical protein